jgi:hypothetical protein
LEKPRIGEEHVNRIRDQILTDTGPVLVTGDDVLSVLGRVPDELVSMTAEGDRDFYRAADVRTILQGGKLADAASSIEPDGTHGIPPFLARPEIEKPVAGEYEARPLPEMPLPPIPASARLPELPRNPDPKTLEWNPGARMFCLKSNRRPRPVRAISCIYCGTTSGARVCDRCHQIVLSLRGVTGDDQILAAVHRILAAQDRTRLERADRDRRKELARRRREIDEAA